MFNKHMYASVLGFMTLHLCVCKVTMQFYIWLFIECLVQYWGFEVALHPTPRQYCVCCEWGLFSAVLSLCITFETNPHLLSTAGESPPSCHCRPIGQGSATMAQMRKIYCAVIVRACARSLPLPIGKSTNNKKMQRENLLLLPDSSGFILLPPLCLLVHRHPCSPEFAHRQPWFPHLLKAELTSNGRNVFRWMSQPGNDSFLSNTELKNLPRKTGFSSFFPLINNATRFVETKRYHHWKGGIGTFSKQAQV